MKKSKTIDPGLLEFAAQAYPGVNFKDPFVYPLDEVGWLVVPTEDLPPLRAGTFVFIVDESSVELMVRVSLKHRHESPYLPRPVYVGELSTKHQAAIKGFRKARRK